MSDDVNVLSGDIEQYRYDARGRLIEISHAGQVAFNCTYRNEGGGEGGGGVSQLSTAFLGMLGSWEFEYG